MYVLAHVPDARVDVPFASPEQSVDGKTEIVRLPIALTLTRRIAHSVTKRTRFDISRSWVKLCLQRLGASERVHN